MTDEKRSPTHTLDAYGVWVKSDPQNLGKTPPAEPARDPLPFFEIGSDPSAASDPAPLHPAGSEGGDSDVHLDSLSSILDDTTPSPKDYADHFPDIRLEDPADITPEGAGDHAGAPHPGPSDADHAAGPGGSALVAVFKSLVQELVCVRSELRGIRETLLRRTGEHETPQPVSPSPAHTAAAEPEPETEKITLTGDELRHIFTFVGPDEPAPVNPGLHAALAAADSILPDHEMADAIGFPEVNTPDEGPCFEAVNTPEIDAVHSTAATAGETTEGDHGLDTGDLTVREGCTAPQPAAWFPPLPDLELPSGGAAPKDAAAPKQPLAHTIDGTLKQVIAYLDGLFQFLPEEKIEEFAESAYFEPYKKLFSDLGLA